MRGLSARDLLVGGEVFDRGLAVVAGGQGVAAGGLDGVPDDLGDEHDVGPGPGTGSGTCAAAHGR
jgi:hypothetical protein